MCILCVRRIVHNLELRDLPANATLVQKISFQLIKILSYHNRLDGLMSFIGIWWGAWTIVFPAFWEGWPVTQRITEVTLGHPQVISYGLLLSGFIGYFAKAHDLNLLRTVCFLVGFVCWCTLTLVFLTITPVFSPGAATYSAFAIAKLLAYVNFQVGIDQPTPLSAQKRVH